LSIRAAAELTRLDLATQNAEMQGLSTTLGGSVVALWELSGTSLLDSPQLSGTVSVAQASLADALDVAGVDVEVERDLGNFELSSQFIADGTTGNVALTELEATVLDMSFAGEFSVTERETTGRIEAPPFNPTTIISLLPEEELEGINLDEVGSLAVSVDFSVNRANQVFSLRQITATIPGATFTGALDRLEGGRRLRGRIATNEIEPNVLLGLFPELFPEGLGPDRLGVLSVNTSFNYDANDDLIELDGLSAQALGLRTTGDLAVQGLSDSPHLIGDLAVEPFSPRELFDRFDQPIPIASDDTVFGSAAINASLDLTGDRGRLEGLHAYLDDTAVTGRFAVERFDDPRYVFDLQLDQVDVDRYLRPAGDDASPDDDSPSASDLLLPTEALSALALEGRVTVSDLSMVGLRFSNVATNVLIENGIGRVDSARADLYGGEFEGGLELDARAGGPLLSLRGSAVTIKLAPLMADLSGQSMFSGTGTFDLDLSGMGESLNDALATASGNVDFSLRDGVIQGFNLNHTLCDVFNRLNNHPRPSPTDEQFSHFDLLRGTAQVSDGIARTYDLIANAPSLQATGNGQLDLVSKNLNYDLEARLTESIPITGCETLDSAVGDSIPLEISGNAREPIILPDFGELLRRGIMDEIQDRLLERLLEN
jgi:AsmA protein